MNQYYSIQGGRRLEGTVTISGAKNAAVAIIPAAILAGECCILENLPAIQDVQTLKHILSRMGAQVDFTRGDCMRVDPTHINTVDATFPEISAMRASYYLLGAMLGAYGEVELALPAAASSAPGPSTSTSRAFGPWAPTCTSTRAGTWSGLKPRSCAGQRSSSIWCPWAPPST